MRRVLLGVIISACFVATVFSQQSATLTIKSFTQASGEYSFEIWAQRTGGTWFVGISSFYLSYNASGLGAPSLSTINTKFTGDGTDSYNYNAMTVDVVAGKIAVTISYTGAAGGSSSLSTASPDGERICTVTLPITNTSETANVAWDETNSSLTATNSVQITQSFAGSDNSPLPVQLASMNAVLEAGGAVKISWCTVSEVDNYGFTVQRKGQGEAQYQDLADAFITGHGTTVEPQNYSYVDNAVNAGVYAYRLKQQDRSGTVHFTQSVQVTITLTDVGEAAPRVFQLNQNYPNPFNPNTQVRFSVETTGRAVVKVYNTLGEVVSTLFEGTAEAGRYYTAAFNAKGLASGVYFYRLTTDQKTDVKRMLLLK